MHCLRAAAGRAPRTALIALIALGALWPSTATVQSTPVDREHYPQLGFVILEPEERRTFVEIAEGELCPCPGAPRSLSECLQDLGGRCSLAEQVAHRMMRLIKEDAEPAAVRDAIVRYITDAQTPREFDLSQAPRRGPADARIQIVVFSDFECPYCRRFADTVEQLRSEFGEQMAVYYLHFPLPQHTNALIAARASLAAQAQGQFWTLHDLLFANQERLQSAQDARDIVLELAESAGLDMGRFRRDLEDESLDVRALADRDAGRAAGVSSTPSCFINGIKYLDQETYASLHAHLSSLL